MKMTSKIVTPASLVLFNLGESEQRNTQYTVGGMNMGSSFAIQIVISPEIQNGVVLECRSESEQNFKLCLENEGTDRKVVFTFCTRGENNPFVLASPIGQDNEHELIILVSDVRTVMLIDGKLSDEEWPLGKVACTEPMDLAVAPGIESLILCSYENTEDSGILPLIETVSTSEGLQYWRPEGHNTGVGDCMPFWHDGKFDLFYLFDRRRHKSKHGLGAHQWAHASSSDLVHWDHHEMAIPITEQWEGSICTGSPFFHDGIYYAFYSARMSDHSDAMLSVSTSEDGVHFHKTPPLTSLQAPYDGPSARDPVVFADETGLFHMLVTTSLKDCLVKQRGGCLAHLTSSDLWHWVQQPPFIVPGYTDQPECADYFFWNGWYYLVFSNNGIARYRMSRNFNGPWAKPINDMLNCPNVTVPKTAEFIGGRRISTGFLHDDYQYASCTVFREIIQNKDGTLGSCFVPEMLPLSNECSFEVIPLTEGIDTRDHDVSIHSLQGFSAAAMIDLPRNKRITLYIVPGGGVFGLCMKSDTGYGCGTELRFDPSRQKVGFRRCNESSIEENSHDSIWHVEGLDHRFMLDIIIKDEFIDVCIDSRRTLITKSKNNDTSVVCLFADCGSASFKDIRIMSLD